MADPNAKECSFCGTSLVGGGRAVRLCATCHPDFGRSSGTRERRTFQRVDVQRWNEVRLMYSFRSLLKSYERKDRLPGIVGDLGEGGALFTGGIPDDAWLVPLRRGLILFELQVSFPRGDYVEILSSLRPESARIAARESRAPRSSGSASTRRRAAASASFARPAER